MRLGVTGGVGPRLGASNGQALPCSSSKPWVLHENARSRGRYVVKAAHIQQRISSRKHQHIRSLSGPIQRCMPAGPQRQGVLGQPLPQHKVSGLQRPRIFGKAFRRGSTLVVCATLAGVEEVTRVDDILNMELETHPGLVLGKLANGLKYVILPNQKPPERFEAHLEVHAGSVDEREHEQGVAHLVEHVTFLGSKRRENLLGTGARANAYTDFHHTVFHVHAPLQNAITQQPMLPQVLEALVEIAFQPQFLPTRIEKERKAVLAEAQMMNTIEYRVDCQLLTYLHDENNLGCRFPIGKTEQVKTWEYDVVQGFWERWYFPANATLYVVGDLDASGGTAGVQQLIEKTFGWLQPATLPPPADGALPAAAHAAATQAAAAASAANAVNVAAAAAAAGNGKPGQMAAAAAAAGEPLLRQRHEVRPPVEHIWGYGPLGENFQPAKVKMFRHPLLEQFMLSVFCKMPIRPMTRMEGMSIMFMTRIIISVFQFRMNQRFATSDNKFEGIDLDISDSGREGCNVATLTITSQPKNWRDAVMIALQEVRKLQRYGVTKGELERYKQAMLMDSEQLAEQANSIPHIDTLDFVMESLALGHTVMDQLQSHKAMLDVAETITLAQVNALARSQLAFVADYGHEAEILEEAAQQPELFAEPGPTRATSIVACVPAYIDASGQSISSGASGSHRNANMGASGHLDADAIDLAALEQQAAQQDAVDVPEGAIAFDVQPEDIAAALSETSIEIEAQVDVEVPEHLISDEELSALVAERQPRYVPLGGPGSPGPAQPAVDPEVGFIQRRLANGIRFNYKYSDNEPKSAMLRVAATGGRSVEPQHAGPDGVGSVMVGVRTLSESGRVGDWEREQVEVFCVSKLINCVLETDEEFVMMDFSCGVRNDGLRSVLEIIHLIITRPVWDTAAMERSKQMFINNFKGLGKNLERATADRIMKAMLGSERRFSDPTPEEVEALTLEAMAAAVSKQLQAGNLEVSIVGDVDFAQVEDLCLKLLGTIPPAAQLLPPPPLRPVDIHTEVPADLRNQTWHLKDSDERAVAYIAGSAPCRYGPLGSRDPLPPLPEVIPLPEQPTGKRTPEERKAAAVLRRAHPLFPSLVLMLLTEVINSRLFTTVRDSLGLTYDVSFEVMTFERFRSAWFSVHVTSYPDKIHDALDASLLVLRTLERFPANIRELNRAKRTILTRHESDLKTNAFWIGLLTHLQNQAVPYKTRECIRDVVAMCEVVTVDDLAEAYAAFDFSDSAVFTCIGTSGKVAPEPPKERTRFQVGWNGEVSVAAPALPAEPSVPSQQEQQVDMSALFAAMFTAAQGVSLATALKQLQGQQPPSQPSSGPPTNKQQ